MLRLKDNVSQCIFLVCKDKSERTPWENVLINIRTVSAISSLFSQNVTHLFEEFGLFDFLVAPGKAPLTYFLNFESLG